VIRAYCDRCGDEIPVNGYGFAGDPKIQQMWETEEKDGMAVCLKILHKYESGNTLCRKCALEIVMEAK